MHVVTTPGEFRAFQVGLEFGAMICNIQGAAQKIFLWQPNFGVPAQENPLYNGAACHVDSILKAFSTFW